MDLNAFKQTPYQFLVFGVLLLVMAGVQTCLGKVVGRNGKVLFESENPWQFWFANIFTYLGGLFMLWLYLRRTFGSAW